MLFAEEYARALLVLHVVVAAALVAVSTHLVLWLRHYPRGKFTRQRGVRIFAVVNAALFVATFIIGNLIYPVYKVRVRTEYLQSPGSLLRDYQQRLHERARVRDQYDAVANSDETAAVPPPAKPVVTQVMRLQLPLRGAKLARWFDVKEHWVALGMAMALAVMVILLVWEPKRHGGVIAPLVFTMAVCASATAWFGALVGIVVTSYRSVGGL